MVPADHGRRKAAIAWRDLIRSLESERQTPRRVGHLVLSDTACRAELVRCNASGGGKGPECFLPALCALEDSAGDVPPDIMLLSPDRQDPACPFEGDFHIG